MTPEQFADAMEEIRKRYYGLIEGADSIDAEDAHIEADEIMCDILTSLGYGEGVAIFNATPKWYS